jgi:phosphoribosyl 1,2-cyclic phosphodiesterase
MIVKFWGVRGSVPVPGPDTVRTGGNTACIQITHGDEVFILDSGTGIRGLGHELSKTDPGRIHIFLSHTHWDHIQGLPFFPPLFRKGQEIIIYGPQGLERGLEDAIAVQLQRLYFPVRRGEVAAVLKFRELAEETLKLGGLRITTKWMNHPVLTLGYHIADGDRGVVYTGDNEPHSFYHVYAPASQQTVKIAISEKEKKKRLAALLDFCRGARLLIADAQYSDEEYPKKIGWGHSPLSYVIDLAVTAGVTTLALFHHDPLHTDEDLDRLLETARAKVKERGGRCEVMIAREGDEFMV